MSERCSICHARVGRCNCEDCREPTLQVDPDRVAVYSETGIFVRAQDAEGKWGSHDIAHLTAASLLAWLRSRGGHNPYAENVVGVLLAHGHLVEPS